MKSKIPNKCSLIKDGTESSFPDAPEYSPNEKTYLRDRVRAVWDFDLSFFS